MIFFSCSHLYSAPGLPIALRALRGDLERKPARSAGVRWFVDYDVVAAPVVAHVSFDICSGREQHIARPQYGYLRNRVAHVGAASHRDFVPMPALWRGAGFARHHDDDRPLIKLGISPRSPVQNKRCDARKHADNGGDVGQRHVLVSPRTDQSTDVIGREGRLP